VIAFLALPGNGNQKRLDEWVGGVNEIGREAFDSYCGTDGIHVIRRSCQTLPCFLVHYHTHGGLRG